MTHSHKKRKDSLEDSLDQVLFAAELEFPKILVPRLPQNSLNVNIECAGKSKQLYSLCDQLLGALIYLHFIALILICFQLIMPAVNYVIYGCYSRSYHYTGASHWRKSIVAVITQDRVKDDSLKREIKNRTLYTCKSSPLTRIFRYNSNWSKVFEHFPTLFLQYT